ncbi:spore germination protein [Clostridium sp. Marseille-P299]|uniref:spore germination protein n=1 Tax=Clostridium sp. Marseille-P299 TaxID=1805477 RepID=UPI000830022C|nr:spore germination protein [Clostridium sp. Marseille-P299]
MKKSHDENNVVTLPLTKKLDENIKTLETLFVSCSDVIKRKLTIGGSQKVNIYLSYVDLMIDRKSLEQNIIDNLLYRMDDLPSEHQFDYIKAHALQTADIKELTTMDEITQAIMSGDVVLLIDGFNKALMISLKSYPSRGVSEVKTEVTIRGAKDSFTESVAINKALIRRRIRDTKLKMDPLKVGIRSRTDITIVYISDLAHEDIINEIKERIDQFVIDGIFDIGMLEHLTEHAWYSPFPQFQSTERPDKVASALLEGRVAILVDNSPMAMLFPVTLSSFFQASDDYYNRWEVVSFIRILRYLASIIAIGAPGLYIAITNYQPEMIPTSLALSFAAARRGVPFSIVLEVIILQIAFELLSEAGIRLPSPLGNTIGIVGGLIIGEAAVSANLVSSMVVIVVAFTAIASFTIPNETFSSAFRLIRYMIIILSAILGLFGFIIGLMLVFIHLASLESFGVPYLSPFVAVNHKKESTIGDSILKYPIFKQKKRPFYANEDQKVRLKERDKKRNGK